MPPVDQNSAHARSAAARVSATDGGAAPSGVGEKPAVRSRTCVPAGVQDEVVVGGLLQPRTGRPAQRHMVEVVVEHPPDVGPLRVDDDLGAVEVGGVPVARVAPVADGVREPHTDGELALGQQPRLDAYGDQVELGVAHGRDVDRHAVEREPALDPATPQVEALADLLDVVHAQRRAVGTDEPDPAKVDPVRVLAQPLPCASGSVGGRRTAEVGARRGVRHRPSLGRLVVLVGVLRREVVGFGAVCHAHCACVPSRIPPAWNSGKVWSPVTSTVNASSPLPMEKGSSGSAEVRWIAVAGDDAVTVHQHMKCSKRVVVVHGEHRRRNRPACAGLRKEQPVTGTVFDEVVDALQVNPTLAVLDGGQWQRVARRVWVCLRTRRSRRGRARSRGTF